MLFSNFSIKSRDRKVRIYKLIFAKEEEEGGKKGGSYLRTPATSQKKHLEEIF